MNKWAKNITKRGNQCSDTHSESQHISGLQNKPTAQWIIKDIKPWNDPQIEKLLHNIFQNKSSVLWGYIYQINKSIVNLYKYLRKTSQEPHNTVFFELSKDLSKVNKELKNISFDDQNQASFLLKGCSFFHRVTLSTMYSIKDNIFSREEFYKIYKEITISYLTQIIMDKSSDKKLGDEHIKNISKNVQLIDLSKEAANISRKYCLCVVDHVKKQYKLKSQLLHSLGANSNPASIIEDSNIQNQSQYLYR